MTLVGTLFIVTKFDSILEFWRQFSMSFGTVKVHQTCLRFYQTQQFDGTSRNLLLHDKQIRIAKKKINY